MKPWIHAVSSSKKFGGVPEDYLPIHQFMDSSKAAIADNRHRALTHNSWFIGCGGPLEMAFGVTGVNSDGKTYSVRDIGEQHILEDFGGKYIPTPQDYLTHMTHTDWMQNGKGDGPESYLSLRRRQAVTMSEVKIID
jgi:hypothetical protein